MKRTSVIFIITLIFVSFIAGGKRIPEENLTEYQRKADYIFMESLSQYADEKSGDYFNMLRHAYNLDTTDYFYNNELGSFYTLLAERDGNLDTALLDRGMNMMRKSFNSNPSDIFSSMRYAALCRHFGLTDRSLEIWKKLYKLYPQKPDIAFGLADDLFFRGDTASINAAIDIYNSLERTQGYGIGLTSQKIRAYLALKDTAGAIYEIESLINKSPSNVNSQLYAGDLFMVIQKPDSALKFYNRALAIDSANGLVYNKLAQYYQYNGDSIAYDREIFNALSQSNLEVSEKIEMMRGYVQNLFEDESQRSRINKLFDVLTSQHPLDADIHDFYSAYLAAIGNYEQSAEQTAIALDLNPSVITNWNRLINLYIILKQYEKAKQTGLNALRFFPEDPTLKLLTSSAYILLENYKPAIDLLKKALKETDSSSKETLSDIETNIGDAFYKMSEIDSAFTHYQRAITYNPVNLMAMNNYAYFLACNDRELDKALNLSSITIKEEPQNPVYLDTYAWILFKKGNYTEAKEYIGRTLEADMEPSAELFEHAGDIYYMNSLTSEALEYWDEAIKLDPDNTILRRKIKEKRYIEP